MYTGGMRARLIRESVYQMVYSSLDLLGWFDVNRKHLPIQFLSNPVVIDENIQPNTAALADFGYGETDDELGSRFAEHRWAMYIDFFGENEAVGLHFSSDVKDIISGRIESIGRTEPNVTIYDYTMATPTSLFTCEFEDIEVQRPTAIVRPYQKAWYSVIFDVLDYYGTETY